MTPIQSPYGSVVSTRSRRLRTVGLLLLGLSLAMVVYGLLFVMPNLHIAKQETLAAETVASYSRAGGAAKGRAEGDAHRLSRAKKAQAVKVLFAWAYWGVCGLLLIAALFVAWLDVREITRNYLYQRQTLRIETLAQTSRDNQTRE